MEEDIIKEIMKQCNWWERIIVKIFNSVCIKIYHISRIKTINLILKKVMQ